MYGKRFSRWFGSALVTLGALTLATASAEDRGTDGQMQDAREQVREAEKVVRQMKQDPKLMALMQRASGIFIAPDYGKGAAIVGASGGEGVLLVRDGEDWSSPAFYNFGGISIGAQAGGAGGSFAMLLMNERATDTFRNKNDFALNANAGLTVVNYSADTQASTGKGDVIIWSDTEGLFAGASIGVSGIVRDEDENRAYYQQKTSVDQVLSSAVKNPDAQTLRDALPDRMASSR